MTEALNNFKKTGTVHEQAQVNELKLQFEGFRNAGGVNMRASQQQQYYDQEEQHYQPTTQQQRQLHISASPTVWSYGKYQQIKQAKPNHSHMQANQASDNIKILTKQAVFHQPESQFVKPSCYNAQFTPNQDYIYLPKTEISNVVDYQKSQIGQTHFVESLDQSVESVNKQLASTQYKNDYCSSGNKAQHNIGPIVNAFCVHCNDGKCFGHTYSNNIHEDGRSQGSVHKEIHREQVLPAINDQFVEQCKAGKVEQTTTLRPMVGGTTSLRQIQVDEWTENTDVIKRLKYDKRTTMRQTIQPMNEAAHTIAQNDRQRSHQMWLNDQCGTNPCGGGVTNPSAYVTSAQFGNMPSVKEMDRRRECSDTNLFQEALNSAEKLYGQQEGLSEWVRTLSIGEQQQLSFLGQQAQQRQFEPYMDYQGKRSLI